MAIVVMPMELMHLLDELAEQAEQALEQALDDDDARYEGWHCINIKPMKCSGCDRTVAYVEPPDFHLIVVWEEKDDPTILRFAARLKEVELEPRIETYYPLLGRCIPWEEVEDLYDGP